jgi:NDP-sugar pyrophosphorylase family protein
MKAGIIAAGIGERLTAQGEKTPKPLLPILGEPMVGRLVRLIAETGVSSLCCIVNEQARATREYLQSLRCPVPFRLAVKTTANSMESLFSLTPFLQGEPFLLFTVDTIFRPLTLKRFLTGVTALPKAKGVLALTRFCDDEKPLRVEIDHHRKVCGIGEASDVGRQVTAGFYWFDPSVFDFAEAARAKGLSALRQFLCFLVERGYPLYGISVAKTIDVDRPEDLLEAEHYLTNHRDGYHEDARCLSGNNLFSRQG